MKKIRFGFCKCGERFKPYLKRKWKPFREIEYIDQTGSYPVKKSLEHGIMCQNCGFVWANKAKLHSQLKKKGEGYRAKKTRSKKKISRDRRKADFSDVRSQRIYH